MTVEDEIRDLERKRLAAFVAKDLDTLEGLHTDDFQLINPFGTAISKRQYLDDVASGAINYQIWEPDTEIGVVVSGDVAAVRYRSQLKVAAVGMEFPTQATWHTDVYEMRDGRWQVVWSQATRVAPPGP